MNEDKLKELKGQAQSRHDEICRLILDGPYSLTQGLVRAFRHGHDPVKAEMAFEALRVCVNDAEATYKAAIAQPEPKISPKQRVVL